MKVPFMYIITASLMAVSATSQAIENCPKVSNIEQVGPGIYRATGEQGEWSGVIQGVVAKTAPVQFFEMALAIQDSELAPQEFQYCSYNVGDHDRLDMRFLANNEKDFTLKTEGDAWVKEDGPFGLIYSVCEKTMAENCTLSLIQK